MFYLKRDLRYTPFFWNFNVKVGNLFFRLTRSFSKTSENRLLFVMKINFAGTTSPISRCRFQVVNAFTLFLGSWWDWNINLKFLLVYVQRGYLFCKTNNVFIIFFCFFSIFRSSFEHFFDRSIPHFLEDMMTTNNTGYFCLVKKL